MNGQRRAMASVWVDASDDPFLVAEAPLEVADLVRSARNGGYDFVELTLGNEGKWNGKPLLIEAHAVYAIGPPMSQEDDE
jgi:hypothetical protein